MGAALLRTVGGGGTGGHVDRRRPRLGPTTFVIMTAAHDPHYRLAMAVATAMDNRYLRSSRHDPKFRVLVVVGAAMHNRYFGSCPGRRAGPPERARSGLATSGGRAVPGSELPALARRRGLARDTPVPRWLVGVHWLHDGNVPVGVPRDWLWCRPCTPGPAPDDRGETTPGTGAAETPMISRTGTPAAGVSPRSEPRLQGCSPGPDSADHTPRSKGRPGAPTGPQPVA